MRERISNVLRSFAGSLCAAALCALFLALVLSIYDVVRTVDLSVLRWAALLLLLAVVDEILAPRGLPLLAYAAVNAVIAGSGIHAVLSATVFVPASEGYPVLLGCMVASSAGLCALYAQKLPDSNLFVRMTDAILCGIVLLMASVHFLEKPVNLPVLGFAAAALALSVAMAAHLRAGGESESVVRGSGVGGALALGAMLGVSLLLCMGLIVLGGGQVDGIVAVAGAVWDGLGRIAEQAVRLLAALLSLNFGKYNVLEREQGHYTVTIVPLDDEQAMGTAPLWVVYGFIGLLALALVALAIALLMDFRGKRVLRAGRMGRRRVVTRKSHLFAAIAALLRSARDAAAFEIAYRFGKRTPRTLYVFASRRCRGKTLGKCRSESPGAYVRRLHAALTAQGEASSLDQLAELINEAIYGGRERALSREEYAAYEEQIKKIRQMEKQSAIASKKKLNRKEGTA